ncbi:hypothetical protein BE17_26015 [Sorangium cellulosum]|uniref:PEGA domain-containing protein n=1 Tax=Sorangium cellulosum TaxID=56 RepID=A0A150RCG5_SORCE|nr:hypothetical protein BE17_26015 [Sorangium cellulosum]
MAELEAGRYDIACPVLAESQRLDPRPGTLFALAECHDKEGRIATAAALYGDYLHAVAQMTPAYKLRHNDRAKLAAARKRALAAEIPELTLVLPQSALAGVRITRDGVELTAASLGMALPVDPGEHVVTTQVGGGPVVEQRITLARSERHTLELRVTSGAPELSATPQPAAGSQTTSATQPSRTEALPTAQAPGLGDTGMSGRQLGALVAGGIGVAGLVLGGVTGAMALSKKSVIEEHCEGTVCTVEGKAAADDARLPGTLSTVGFGVGVVGLAAGVVLWLTAPSPVAVKSGPRSVRAAVDVGPTGVELKLKGAW